MSIRLADLLKRIPPDTEERVQQAKKRVLAKLREGLRRETGLALQRHSGDELLGDPAFVRVDLAPGLPTALQNVEFDATQFELRLILARYREPLEQAKRSLGRLGEMFSEIRETPRGADLLGRSDPREGQLLEILQRLLEFLNSEDPLRKILQVNADVLGAYWYSPHDHEPRGRITIYWAVIGLVALMMGKSVEALAAVVQAHELAHAFTHLGADIEGERWDSRSFGATEESLKEALAQHYTVAVLGRIESRIPDARAVFESLLRNLPEQYHVHQKWAGEFNAEEIRLAMLEVRRKRLKRLEDFHLALSKAKRRLRQAEAEAGSQDDAEESGPLFGHAAPRASTERGRARRRPGPATRPGRQPRRSARA